MATRGRAAQPLPEGSDSDSDSDGDSGGGGGGGDCIIRKAVPSAVLSGGLASLAARGKSIETCTVDYTPITADKPADAAFQLRPTRQGRKVRLLVIVTAYNEAGDELTRTLMGIAANLPSLQAAGLHWSEMQVLIVLDGRAKASLSMLDTLSRLGLYDAALLLEQHGGRPVHIHLYERTVELQKSATVRGGGGRGRGRGRGRGGGGGGGGGLVRLKGYV